MLMSEEQDVCFIIMPFSETTEEHTEEYWTKHFEEYLKPLIENNFDLKAYRSEPLRGDILKQIITDLITVPIVIADLTDYNPNVFWELGVRQSFKHGTITIIDASDKLPFDVGMKGTLKYYPENHIENEKFRKNLIKAIDDCIKHPKRPDSHVLETISGRGTLFEILHKDETIRRFNALISEIDHNIKTLKSIKESAKLTTKKPKSATIPTGRFRTNCIELLIANRYIETETKFYEVAESYHKIIVRMDSQLRVWGYDAKNVATWVIEQYDKCIEIIKEFFENAVTEGKKIEGLV